MKMTTKEILEKARERISNPQNWCKKETAKKKVNDGFVACGIKDPGACQWCATGALDAVIPFKFIFANLEPRRAAWKALDNSTPIQCIVHFNDNRETTHKEIIEIFDRAIEACK